MQVTALRSWWKQLRSAGRKPKGKTTSQAHRRAFFEPLEDRRVLAAAFAEFVDPHPAAGNQFGATVTPLSTGNVVITSPFDDAGGTDAGAVYLFNGATGALISTLTGSHANDNVGSSGVTTLTNGNYLIRSSLWDNGTAADVGALTFGNGVMGISGVVSAANSLVGSTASDQVGSSTSVTTLTNGNYLVTSLNWDNGAVANAGAVTFGSGTTGVSGVISSSNSLIGSTANDLSGSFITVLTNDNYVVRSPNWNNGAVADAGAATFGSGSTGISGVISSSNSLVGSTASDKVGSVVTKLGNGNYVVITPTWDNGGAADAGAVTFGSGTTGVKGVITSSNSLVGTLAGDQVGIGSSGGFDGITVLTNNNYVIRSKFWDNGAVQDVGAATWAGGTTGITGTISSANSLIGSTASDLVSNLEVQALTNGNYVVASYFWDNGAATDAGAATWGNGTTGVKGVVSSANSLVGTITNDMVGLAGITALPNGNYVVSSSTWANGGATQAGAVTFANGTTGISGNVTSANSLVGTATNDNVGSRAFGGASIVVLGSGNYVVASTNWSGGRGAVTFANGATGIMGAVSSSNSLVGSTASDLIGRDVYALNNGNYVVQSYSWDNGAATDAGFSTFGSGTAGITGVVSSSNSLVGTSAGDKVGNGLVELTSGNYVTYTPYWNSNMGAVTFGSGTTGVKGNVTSSNSLVGSATGNQISLSSVGALTNGNYVVLSYVWDNGASTDVGAATFGSGTTGVSGAVSTSNSLYGATASDRVSLDGMTALPGGNYLVRSRSWQNGAATGAGAVTFASGTGVTAGAVGPANSLVGSATGDNIGNVTVLGTGNYVVWSSTWDNGALNSAGAVAFGNGATGVTGAISAANSVFGLTASAGLSTVTVDNVNGNFYANFVGENGGKVRVGSQIDGFDTIDVVLSGGNLSVTGLVTDNSINVSRNGANVRIQDLTNQLTAGSGATQIDIHTVEVPFANITGGFTLNTVDGDDTVTVDLSGGDAIPTGNITYNGGNPTSGPGDKLVIIGGSQGTVTYNYTNGTPGAGSVVMSNFGTVNYTGLEPLTNSGTATDVIFNLPTGPNTVTLGDDGVSGNSLSRLSAVTFEQTNFANPTNSLTINRGNAADSILVNSLPDFNRSLTLGSSAAPFGAVHINAGFSLAAGFNFAAAGSVINVGGGVTTNGGTINLEASGDITIQAPIVSNGGNQTLKADSDGNGSGTLTLQLAPAELIDPHPATGNQFGATVVVLPSGNVVVTSPFDDLGGTDAGAVYVFNGFTGALITTLTGSHANDNIGSGGVKALGNGNFVVSSPNWDNGAVSNVGAATWGSGTTGVSGAVSAANSLIGSTASDSVGGVVVALTNGNYLVVSTNWDNGAATNAGAVTWVNGAAAFSGVVSAANSLVGSSTNDTIGITGGVVALPNGNYVVFSSNWDNGAATNAGAVTWGNGSSGVTGAISAANSLIGSTTNDNVGSVGSFAFIVLSNGNYVVNSFNWDNGATPNVGAVTWGSGTSGVKGVISAANSLIGSTANDQVGGQSIVQLSNGNYVVLSPNWDNGAVVDVGAATWASGTAGITGTISAANSLIGSTAGDQVGFNGTVTALTNGNYVVCSYLWDNGAVTNAGAATFGNGATGVSGVITAANSLVGSTSGDSVGLHGATALTNGNYVVISGSWDNGAATNAGAVTFGNGTTGVSGAVSSGNSLVGSTASDQIGTLAGVKNVTALTNGNYVVGSPTWNNGAAADAGAATLGNGTTGVSGVITAANSLVGSLASSFVGNSVTALTNANYVVASPSWGDGTFSNVGAVTWGNGTTGISGVVSSANSLVGSSSSDQVGSFGILPLSNGNYVVRSGAWNNGAVNDAGAVTWGSGTTGVSGLVSAANSLVGSTASDQVGSVTVLGNGNYVVSSPNWDSGALANAGAVTFGNGAAGVSGTINTGNSAVGGVASAGLSSTVFVDGVNGVFLSTFTADGGGRARTGSQTTGFATSAGSTAAGAGSVTATAADAVLNGTITSSATVAIAPKQTNRSVDLGTNTAGALGLTDAELDQITAAVVQIGDANSGAITVSAPLTHNNNLSLTTGAGLTVNSSVTMSTVNKSLTASAVGTISLATSSSDLSSTGTGAVSLTTNRDLSLTTGSSVTTADGAITLSANQQASPTAATFIGVTIDNALVQATGSGNVTVLGKSGNGSASQKGVVVTSTTAATGIRGGTAGVVTVTGTGVATGGNTHYGVQVTGSQGIITSSGATINVTGTAGGGTTGTANVGVTVDTGGQIVGTAATTVTGTGGQGSSSGNSGVMVNGSGAKITSSAGGLTITGVAATTNGSTSSGVDLTSSGSITTTGAATLTIAGTGAATGTGTSNYGVWLRSGTTFTSASGAVQITGTAGGGSLGFRNEIAASTTAAPITIIADSIDLASGSLTANGANTITLRQKTNGTLINLGGADVFTGSPLTLGLTDAELDLAITTGVVQIGDANSGTITVSAAITHANNLNMTTGAGITINQAVTTAVNKTLTANAVGTISLPNSTSDLATSGSGAISLTTARDILLAVGSSITTVNGNLTLNANQQVAPTSGNFTGIDVNGLIQSTGAGGVTVKGRGGNGASSQYGVALAFNGDGDIIGGTTAPVVVEGTGGAGTSSNNFGVEIRGTNAPSITSAGANVSITGFGGGTGSTQGNLGVEVGASATVSAGSGGTVLVQGTGGATSGNGNHGVQVNGTAALITSSGGAVQVIGQGGGSGSSGSNAGVYLLSSGTITAGGTAAVNVQGTGGNSSGGSNAGVWLFAGNPTINSGGGTVTVVGEGAGTGSFGAGGIVNNGTITAGATGGVSLQGTASATNVAGGNFGVSITGVVTSNGGNVQVTGLGVGTGGNGSNTGVSVSGLVTAGGGGTVTVNGTGGGGFSFNYGVDMTGVSGTITSGGGNVSVVGQGGGSGTGSSNSGVHLSAGTFIRATGAGTVSVQGTGGTGGSPGSGHTGVDVAGGVITSAGGSIQVTGQGGPVGLSSNRGVAISSNGAVTVPGSGDIVIDGNGGGGTQNDAFNLGNLGTLGSVTATGTGNITILGDRLVIDPSGTISAGAHVVTLRQKTNATTIDLGAADSAGVLGLTDAELDRVTAGTLQIGNGNSGAITVSATISPANYPLLSLAKDTTFTATGGLTLDVSSASIYEKVQVNGNVSINAAAALTVNSSYNAVVGDVFNLIENTSAGTTTGAFSGKPEGAAVAVGTFNKRLTYVGGTGSNDVQLFGRPAYLATSLASGTLTVTDTNASGSDNNLTVKLNGANLEITDANEEFIAPPAAGTLSNGNRTLSISFASMTAGLVLNTAGGNDTVTVDLSAGDAIPAGNITFNGGNPTTVPGDKLVISGGNQGTVTYNYTNAHDGNVVMSNYGTVNYAGLEPITNSGSATDIIFNLPAGPNTVTMGDDGSGGNTLSRLSGATFEQTDFTNPTGTLTINRGNAADTITINALPDFNAGLTAGAVAAPFAVVSISGAVALGPDKNLALAGTTLNVTATGTITVFGAGSATWFADDVDINITATVSAAATVSIVQITPARAIDIGGNTAGMVALTDAELDRITASTLQIGNANSGAITVSADITRPAPTKMQLISGGDIVISGGQVNSAGGTLLLDSGNSPAAVKPTKSGLDVTAGVLSFGGDLAVVIDGVTADTQFTQLNIAGQVNLTAVNLLLSGSYVPAGLQPFQLVNNDGVEPVVGTFVGLPEGAIISNFLGSGHNASVSYRGGDGNDVVLTVYPTTQWVNSFTPTSTGVRFTLSQAAAIAGLNLYDFRDTAGASVMGAADVQLVGPAGNVAGSLVIDAGEAGFAFVATDGVLPPGNYSLALRSAAEGFHTAGGTLLDGDADNVPGGNYATTFTVATPPVNAVTVSLPNFARGPQQAVNVPESSALGLPLKISSGANLVSMTFELQFDSGLLNVTDITLAAGISGSKSFSLLSPGRAQVTLTFTTPLTGGSQTVAYFTANVPTSAANRYGERGVLDLTNISLLASGSVSVPAIDQDAAHVNAYFGDASRDGSYNSFDVQQVSRAAVGLDTGYQQHLLLDPRIISDFDGSAGINSFDVQRVSRLAVGLSILEAPPLPIPPVTVNSTGNFTAEESVDKPEPPVAAPVVAPTAPIATPPVDISAPQHNAAPGLRSDVDNDGIIDAQDILWAVYLYTQSLNGSPSLSDTSATNLFADINGDNQIDPADILLAVSDLSVRTAGEGEAAATTASCAVLVQVEASDSAEDLDSLAYLLAADLEAVRKKK